MAREPRNTPAELIEQRTKLDAWRQENPPRSKLPESFWAEAVALAQRHGINRTARALHLDYTCLRRRMPQSQTSTFIEFRPAANSECVIELDSMRITLRAMPTPEMASLIRSLRL